MLKEKKMASNKQKIEQLFEAAQSVVSESRFPLPRKVQMRNKLLAKLDKMGVGEKELRSIRGTRAAIDGMEGQEEAIDLDKEFEDAPADEEGTGRPKRAPDPVSDNIPNGKDRRAAIYHSKEEQRHRNAAIDGRIKAVHHTNMAKQHRDSRIELLRKHGLVD